MGTVVLGSHRIRARTQVYRRRRRRQERSGCPAKMVETVRRPRVHSNNYRQFVSSIFRSVTQKQ
jgi:hypothetical protein